MNHLELIDLEKEDAYKKKGLLNYVPRQFKPNLDFKFERTKTNSFKKNIKPKKHKKIKQETESVLNDSILKWSYLKYLLKLLFILFSWFNFIIVILGLYVVSLIKS